MKKLLFAFLVCTAALEAPAAASRAVLALPFENKTQREDLAWLSESFAETVAARLSGNGRIILTRAERDAGYREAGLPPGASISRASAFKVAKVLDAGWVVTGKVSLEGGTLRSVAFLLDASRLELSGPFEVSGDLAELAELQTRLAWRILAANDPGFTIGSEEDFGRQFPALRLDAHENYIRGVLSTEPETRVRFLTEAQRRDPADPRAAFELARHFYELKDYEDSAKWLAKLPPAQAGSVEARFLRGVSEFFLGREAASEKTFAQLAAEAPLAEIWNNLGLLQSHLGRWMEATASFDRAYQANSADPDFGFNLGVCMWNLKRSDVAARYLREAVQAAPDDPEIHRVLREALGVMGDADGKKKEDLWLEKRGDSAANGGAAILPNPRLKKQFDWRAYRAWQQMGHAGKPAPARSAAVPVEAKP
jgi:tetratricopeptide (TPR) repeat protein